MKEFNKKTAANKIIIKQNRSAYIKKLSIALSCLIVAFIAMLFTFAKYETYSVEYTLINGKLGDYSTGDITLSFIVDGQSQSAPPLKGEGYKLINYSCTNATAEWNRTKWSIEISNMTGKVKCDLEFETFPEVIAPLYSAAEDAVYYYNSNNERVDLGTTDSTGKIDEVVLPVNQNVTLYSSVAKDPNNLNNYYSKTFYFTDNVDSIMFMPAEGDNMVYWFGYIGNCDDMKNYPYTFNKDNTYYTNYIDTNGASGIIGPNPVTKTTAKAIALKRGGTPAEYLHVYPSLTTPNNNQVIYDNITTIHLMTFDFSSYNMETPHIAYNSTYGSATGNSNGRVYALWAE